MKVKLLGLLAILSLAGTTLAVGAGASIARPAAPSPGVAGVKAGTSFARAAAPVRGVKATSRPPALSPAKLARLNRLSERGPMPGPAVPSAAPAVGPSSPATQTRPDTAAAAVKIYSSSTPNPVIPSTHKSTVNETSGAMIQTRRFITGNWYAAFSNNSGTSWNYLNPFTTFPASDGGFCCDQVGIYEPSRNLMFWLLQYLKSSSTSSGINRLRLAIYRDPTASPGITAGGWYYYDFFPSQVGGPASGEWFDYPHFAVSSNNLYIAVNVFSTCCDRFTRSVMMRLPLDPLRAGAGFSFNYYSQSAVGTFTPAQRGTTTMYWASHVDNNTMRIFRWAESSGQIFWDNRDHPAYTTGVTHSCPTADGQNWCPRSDERVIAGTRSRNPSTGQMELIFFWNVAQGGGFPVPYVDAIRLRESDRAVLGRPFIWSQTVPWHWAAAYPNSNFNVGLAVFGGYGTNRAPSVAACIYDASSGVPPGWDCGATVQAGTNGPFDNKWGDYLTVRPAGGAPAVRWMVNGWALVNGKQRANIVPRHAVFGR